MTTSKKLLKRLKDEFPEYFNRVENISRVYGHPDCAKWFSYSGAYYIFSCESMAECLKAKTLYLDIDRSYGNPKIIISC